MKKYSMNKSQAEQALKNVYSACDIKQIMRGVSLREIEKRHRKENFSSYLLQFIVIFFLVLVLLAPLAFHVPKAFVKQTQREETRLQVYQHHVEDEVFYLTFSGDEVDYDHIQIITSSGDERELLGYDEASSTITFSFTSEELNLFIPDTHGGQLQLLLTPRES